MTASGITRRGSRVACIGALLVAGGIARGQNYTSTQIPTIPRSLGAVVSDDSRWLYTLSSNNAIGVIDTSTDHFVEGINLSGFGVSPTGVAFSHGKLYVECYDNIVVVDAASRQVLRALTQPFALGQTMGDVDLSPDGRWVYTVSGTSSALSVVDPTQDVVVATVDIGRNHTDLAISPDGTRGYAINSYDATVTIVDLVNHSVVGETSFVSGRPFINLPAEAAMRSDGMLYVAWTDPNYLAHVSRLDRDGHVQDVFNEPFYSTGIAFSLDEQTMMLGGGYVVNSNDGSLISQIPTTNGIARVVFAPSGERAFVTNSSWLHVLAVNGFRAVLTRTGSSAMGNTITLNMYAPVEHGRLYQVGLAGSMNTGILMPNGELFPLDRDALFRTSMRGADSLTGFSGHIGSDGRATATIRLSNALPGCAIGQTLYVAFGTFTRENRSMAEVSFVSNVVPVPILP